MSFTDEADMGLDRLHAVLQQRVAAGHLSPDAASLFNKSTPTLGHKVSKISSKLDNAIDIAMLEDGSVVAADSFNGFIKIFDHNGRFDKTLARGRITPLGVTVNRSGMIYFTDCMRKKEKFIRIYSRDGWKLGEWSKEDWKPRGIAISNKGLLVVGNANTKDQDIGIYTQDGKELLKFGSKGDHREQFNNPWYIYVDMYDRILVSDHNNDTVKIWDDRGKLLGVIGERGSNDGQLLRPRGIVADGNGNIYVADTGNVRVSVFSPNGQFIENILTKDDGIVYPYGLGFSKARRRLAVSQHNSERGNFRKIRVYEIDDPDFVEELE